MCSERRRVRGFTIVELMVGLAIGLLTTLIITQVLAFSEGQKRTTTTGTDAQVNGALALYALQREITMAGYGFTSSPNVIGCPLYARFAGADIATGAGTPRLATTLAPVLIDATDPVRNTVRVLASSKQSYSIPTRIVPPSYDPGGAGTKKSIFPVSSSLGIAAGDLLVAAKDGVSPCELFEATADPAADGAVPRGDDGARWNPIGYPTAVYTDGDTLVNLGNVVDRTYSVTAANVLQVAEFSSASPTTAAAVRELHSNIVTMVALYGKDTDGDRVVDRYDQTTPVNNAGWQQVLSVRIAVVARGAQYEKDVVTAANPLWDVGTSTTVSPAPADCGTSKCLTLTVDPGDGTDAWKHYRYKVFDTIVPLRNMLWNS